MVWLVWVGTDPHGSSSPLRVWMVLEPGAPEIRALLLHVFFHHDWMHLCGSLAALAFAGRLLEARWGSCRFGLFFAFVAAGSALVALGVESLFPDMIVPGDEAASRGTVTFGSAAIGLASLAVLSWVDEDDWDLRWVSKRSMLWALILLGATGLVLLDQESGGFRPFLLPQISGLLFGLIFVRVVPFGDRLLLRRQARRLRAEEERVLLIRQRVDQLLEKISVDGFDSLSPGERSFLEDASKHYRGI